MKVNKWTAALASAGVIGGVSAHAEESPVMTALSSTTISGYVDVAAHWNPDTQNGAAFPGPYTKGASVKDDGFNLNVVNLTIEKPLDESQWAAGYKAELLFGPDATAFNPANGSDGTSDFAIKQAYVDLRAPLGNGLDFKFGVFDTVIGYEVFNNGGNPNYTRSWGWSVEPTQHTGVLATYAFNETISVSGGVANTLTPGINNRAHTPPSTKGEEDKTWMGSIAITAPESLGFLEGSTLYGGVVYGFNNTLGATGGNQANYYAGATLATPVAGLSLGAAFDYVNLNTPVGGASFQNVFGVYASFQATEKLSLHARGEYGYGELITLNNAGDASELWSITATVQYDLWANVLTRLEFRYDDVEDGSRALGAGGLGWDDDEQILIALNAIYSF